MTNITYSICYMLYNSNFISWILYTYYPISTVTLNPQKSHAKALFRGISWAGNNETSQKKTEKLCNKNQPSTLFLQTSLWTLMTTIVPSGQDYSVPTFAGKRTFVPSWSEVVTWKNTRITSTQTAPNFRFVKRMPQIRQGWLKMGIVHFGAALQCLLPEKNSKSPRFHAESSLTWHATTS